MVIIQSQELIVKISEQGAELQSVLHHGKERLWQNESGEWNGKAPLLFPVCGHCGLTVDGKQYPLPAHGFAKKSLFTLLESGEDYAIFLLSASDETRKVYPFEFDFVVTYRVQGSTMTVVYDVKNKGDEPLYFACGSHESFVLEKELGAHKLVFEKDEKLIHLYHDEGGYLTGKVEDLGEGKELILPEQIISYGETLILEKLNSRKVALCQTDGKAVTEITFEGFSNLLLWRPGKAKMICIEPWLNLPDLANAEDVEFSSKSGVEKVKAKETKTLVRTITYQ